MTPACSDRTNEELAVLAGKDEKALEKLVRQNEGFVVLMASAFLKRRGCYDLDAFEDYCQICRISIMKAVKNYDPDRGNRFITYAGRIMRNDMLKQMEKDEGFREIIAGELMEETDTVGEECDEEYGDVHDNSFEERRSYDPDSLRSYVAYVLKDIGEVEQTRFPEETGPAWLERYSDLIQKILNEETEETQEDPQGKQRNDIRYLSNKETDFSWKYPVFHEALHDLQIKTVLTGLLDESFDPAQREYLIYRFGLRDLEPKNLKETAEHFHLSVSYAKRIEEKGLGTLRATLQRRHF